METILCPFCNRENVIGTIRCTYCNHMLREETETDQPMTAAAKQLISDDDPEKEQLQPVPLTAAEYAPDTQENDLADQFASSTKFTKAEDAAGAYAEAFLESKLHGEKMILRETAKRRLIATSIFALAAFITLSLMMLYHRSYGIFLVIFAALGIGYYFSRTDNRAMLAKKMASMPQADMENVMMSDIDRMVSGKVNNMLRISILAVFLAVFVALFWSPRMIFEKGNSGYSLRYYSAAFRPAERVVIPDTWNGEPVTEIRGNVFQGLNSIYSVVLPDHLVTIRAHAFRSCSNLRNVTFPSTIESIGSSAFRDCTSLRKVTLPSGCSVNERAFKNSNTIIERK